MRQTQVLIVGGGPASSALAMTIDPSVQVTIIEKRDLFSDENFRKLLVSFAEDVRVIICLIADRYVLMQMLASTADTDI